MGLFGRITQDNGHYAVQGHSRSPLAVVSRGHCVVSLLLGLLSMMYNRQTRSVDQHGYLSQRHHTYTTDSTNTAITTATTTAPSSATTTTAVPISDDVSDDVGDDVMAVDEGDGEGQVQGQGQTEGEETSRHPLVNVDSTAQGL